METLNTMSARWKKTKIGQFLFERKGKYQPDDEVISDLKKIEKITFSDGNVLIGKYKQTKTQQIIVEPGDFVFSGLNIEKGAVSINKTGHRLVVSANYSSCEVDYSIINKEYFLRYIRSLEFKQLLIDNLKKDYGFTRPKDLYPLEINLPDIEEQQRIVSHFQSVETEGEELQEEIACQKNLLKKLRQQILQEAIEGNLTAEWRQQNPDVEPAGELLARIQAEKEQLVKDKKIKKQKPLLPISDAEKPFDLPDGWVWCRLGDISDKIHYGFNAAAQTHKQGIRMLRITDIQNNFVIWDNVPHCECKDKDVVKYLLNNNDILIARTGGTIGKSYIVKNIDVKSLFASYLIRVVPNRRLKTEWLKLFIESPTYWNQLYEAAWGAGQPNVNGTALSKLLIPLPPLPEQKAIVTKVEKLLALCDQMETQITASQIHAKQLMQSVLKEVFSHPPG